MTEKLNPEELRERFAEIGKNVDEGKYDNAPRVYKRRVALIVMGEYLPQYNTLSEEEKQNFEFDVQGLVKKVKDFMK